MTRTAKAQKLSIREQECLEALGKIGETHGQPIGELVANAMSVSVATAYRLIRSLKDKGRLTLKETVTVEVKP